MRRARGDRGFTLVELLITIVLAGIVFAALVPVFVSASQQGSTDRARIIAINTAQSAVERLRDLPYDDLYDTHWSDPTTRETVLGQTLEWKGSTSDLTVDVEPYPLGSQKGAERYLVASVKASWTGPGDQSHEVVMKTAIYREGLGTETLVLYVTPLTGGVIRQSTAMVTGRLGGVDAAKTESIIFTVYANNGTVIDNWTVTSAEATVRADGYTYYEDEWDATALEDGRYSFVAKTVPMHMDPLPPSEWARKEYILDREPPSDQVVDTCHYGFQMSSSETEPEPEPTPFVYLAWHSETSQSDIDHFEISRTGVAAGGTALAPLLINVPNWSTEYVDRDVIEGATYTYAIRGWDTQDQHGEWSPEPGTAIVTASDAAITPAPPESPITYTVNGRSVTVIWQPSTTPELIDHYRIYRQGADGTRLLVTTVEADTVSPDDGLLRYPDPFVDYGATYTYFITSVVLLGAPPQWESLSLSGAPVRVPEPPKVGMRVSVSVKAGVTAPKLARLVIHDLVNGDLIPANPWDYASINPSSSNENQNTWVTGDILYPGSYQVIAVFYDQNRNVIAEYLSDSIELTQSDTPVTVPYDGPNR